MFRQNRVKGWGMKIIKPSVSLIQMTPENEKQIEIASKHTLASFKIVTDRNVSKRIASYLTTNNNIKVTK